MTPREELEALRAEAAAKAGSAPVAIMTPRQELEALRATAKPEPSRRELLDTALARARKEGGISSVNARTPFDPNASIGGEVLRGVKNLPGDALDATVGSAFGMVKAAAHPIQTARAIRDAAVNAKDIATGGYQTAVDALARPGSAAARAPKLDTTAYDKFAEGNYEKFGGGRRILHTLADNPALPVATAVTLGRAALNRLPAGAIPAIPKPGLPRVITKYTRGGREGRAMAASMEGNENRYLSGVESGVKSVADEAYTRADRARALAERARAAGNESFARRMDAVAGSKAQPVKVGEALHTDDAAAPIRAAALKTEAGHSAEMRAGYAAHEAATKAIAQDLADRGIGASDGPKAQALIGEVQDALEPHNVKRKKVGNALNPGREGAAHKSVLDRLTDTRVDLTPAEAKEARAMTGPDRYTVYTDKSGPTAGQEYRIVKPNLEAIENLHRELGDKAFGKEVEGWGTVSQKHAQDLYDKVNDVLDEYTGGAHGGMRKVWREGKDKLQAFEKIKAGRDIVGVQRGTDVPTVPTNKILERMIGGGRDTLNQVRAVAGDAPVEKAVRSMLQNDLSQAKSAAAMKALIAPGSSKYGTILEELPAVKADVNDAIARALNAEAQGAAAKGFESRAATASGRAKRLDAFADALEGKATKAMDTKKYIERELVDLEIVGKANPKEVGARYTKMLEKAHADRSIDIGQYKVGRELAASAEKAFANEASRKQWLRNASFAVGLPALGYMTAGPAGVAAGAGLMALRPHVKKLTGGRR